MVANYADRVKRLDNGLIICNEKVTLGVYDWDDQCETELLTKSGFRITEKGKTDVDVEPGMYSIHSPLYGTDYGDSNAFEDRYKCKCGNLQGKHYADDDTVCPKCGHKVVFVDIDMKKTGWIILDRDYIIQPEMYRKIASFIGAKPFDNMIKYVVEDKRETSASEPFHGIGLIEFKERFAEIMDFYLRKNKKLDMYLFIMSQQRIVFTHCIPVYNSHLRHFVIKGEDVKYSDEDKVFRKIFSNHLLLNNQFELARRKETRINRKKDVFYLRRENILYRIQLDVDAIWNLSFQVIDKKTGLIKDQVLGGRTNFTARNVIVPDVDLRADEINLGYITFLELYRLELISLLVKTYKISYTEAGYMWTEGTMVFSDKIYQLMNYMIRASRLVTSIDRNPSRQINGRLCSNAM